MSLTLAQQLDNYRARWGTQLTVSKIAEPWVRVRYWADHVRAHGKEIAGYWPGEAPDDLVNDYHDCIANWMRELKRIQDRAALNMGDAAA